MEAERGGLGKLAPTPPRPIGRGSTLSEATRGMKMVAEGVVTVRSAQQLSVREAVEMPITGQVFEVLYRDKDPRRAIDELLARALVEE